ncbi:MAG: C25 family cysteine peptidase, partial [Thermoanaerobaculia bacterium]
SNTLPAGADNAWLALIDSTGDTVRDNFGTIAYSNNDGLVNWAGDWFETNDDNNAANGEIRITGGELRIGDNGGAVSTIEREANLSGAGFTTATLTFDLRTTGVDAGDQMRVEVSANGGGSWTTLETFTGPFAATSRSYDITARIATNTRVRFIQVSGYGNNDFFFVDNLQIKETGIDAGHWEVRVDMSSAVTGGDDINAFGLRAHDGTSGSGGTEFNAYYDSHNQYGVNPPGAGTTTRAYDFFPYLTSGCTAAKNDFDYDSNSGTVGSLAFSSRSGSFTQSYASASLSTNNVWRRDSFSGWTSDTRSVEYGIWSADVAITSYLVGGTPNGNYANLWMSNFNAAANPPAANPTTNAFRVYLPNDAGTAPAKPYVEQVLAFTGCGVSGPNPPVVGRTSCFTVTVKVANPAAQAITFSAANLVTANVPGGTVLYAGGAQVSQGSIVSQPAVGGSGNITWNPGSVAAGGTALLSYRLNVTPTSAGQRIPVTGTAASGNGTRAQYLDETGASAQTRATYLFGPLCELAVTENLLTHAVVSSFRASPAEGGGVLLEWRTASEAGTAGFYVQRRDAAGQWTRVNRELLPGLLDAPQGGTYRYVDEGASPHEPPVYRLVEVEAGGGRRTYGPFAAAMDWSRPERAEAKAFEREAHPPTRFGDVGGPKAAGRAAVSSSPGTGGVRVAVREAGLYYLGTEEVAAWLGLPADKAGKEIAQGKVALFRNDRPVAFYPDLVASTNPGGRVKEKDARGLFFYAESADSLYSAETAYRLQGRPGLLMDVAAAGAAPATPGGTFADTRHVERDAFPATVVATDPDADYWFWEFLQGNSADFGTRAFPFDAPGASAADGGALTIAFQGATATGVTDEHQALVSVNGSPLGETRWTGLTARQATFPVPPGVLQEGGNRVEVTARTGDGAPYSIFYLDAFDVSYQRAFRAVGDSLAFTPAASRPTVVGGFTSAAIRLLDVSDPLRPRWVAGAAVEPDGAGGFRLTFTPTASARYLATAVAAAPAGIRRWNPPALRASSNRAEYLVVAPAALHASAERLADLRRAQGLESRVVDLEQVMDEFNAGDSDPRALRTFLSWARANWSLPPRYVALAGEGTLDYRDLLGFGDNLLPPLMIRAEGGLFPSDNLLGDVDGDGLPEMAVGRIPVLSAAELDAYTAKIAEYEATAPGDWSGRGLLVSDAPDRGASFGEDNERIAAHIRGDFTLERIDLATLPLAAARGQLISGLAQGAAFVNYMGHGALDRFSAGGLLTLADVPALGNHGRLPVVTAMTCTINRFAVPGTPALGEQLVKSGTGGAAAVWGPSGLSAHGEARLLAERFYQDGGEARLGDRILRAVKEFRALGGQPDLPRIYDLLGDPALRLVGPAAGAGGAVGTGE